MAAEKDKYLTLHYQNPTLIPSWMATRQLQYVMSITELLIYTPLLLKACSTQSFFFLQQSI